MWIWFRCVTKRGVFVSRMFNFRRRGIERRKRMHGILEGTSLTVYVQVSRILKEKVLGMNEPRVEVGEWGL